MSIPHLKFELTAKRRVICYVDGFNLYFGLRDAGMRSLLWLDLPKLAGSLIHQDQNLTLTRYFTSRIAGPEAKRKRQTAYLEALSAFSGNSLQIEFEKYVTDTRICRHCSATYDVPSEKMTDVNIAVALLSDAYQDLFDTALLNSADSDLVPAVSAVKSIFPQKRVCVAFPPARFSNDLRSTAHAGFSIGRARLSQAQMPREFEGLDGVVHRCPAKWMPQAPIG